MIKLGLKNYLKSYRLFFLPIGALSLGIVIGLSIFLPALLSAIKDFFSGAVKIIGDVKPNWEAVWETISSTFLSVDYADIELAAREIFNRGFFGKLLNDCIHAAIDFDALQVQFEELLSACATKAIGAGVAFLVFSVLGAVVGVFATRVEIRRNVAKRKFWKFILISIVHTVINATIIAVGAYLITKFEKYAVIAGILTFLLYGAVTFFEAYLVHGYKKVSLRKVLRVRNFLSLALLSVIEIAVMIVLIALVLYISNVIITFFVGFSVVVITLSCVSLNAEAYVKDMADAAAKAAAPVLSAPAEGAQSAVIAPAEGGAGVPALTTAEEAPAVAAENESAVTATMDETPTVAAEENVAAEESGAAEETVAKGPIGTNGSN